MYNANKTPANWVRHFELENGGRAYVSDKGAIKLVTRNEAGEEKFVVCIMPSQLEFFRTLNLGPVAESEEYKQIMDARQDNKHKQYLERKIAAEQTKAAKTIQAALDNLKALGLDPSQAQAALASIKVS